jgi:hypothetical protein
MTKKIRMARLDHVQYRALHALNACTKLTLKLSENAALEVQRRALSHVSSGIFTLKEAAEAIGIDGIHGSSSNGGAKGSLDALDTISAAGPENAARLLAYARAAWLSESVLIVELGPRSAGRQVQALYHRLQWPGADAMAKRDPTTIDVAEACKPLPIQATTLHACTECSRIANACVYDTSKTGGGFNELGVSSSMISSDPNENGGCMHIRCAKRSSAALRGAVVFETDMKTRCVDADEGSVESIEAIMRQAALYKAAAGDSGVAARIRRDSKNALEQRHKTMPCGENAMLAIPLVGRVVRVFDEWFALCAVCGVVMRVHAHCRFGGEICCMRCDAELLGIQRLAAQPSNQKICRFCGKVDAGTGAKYKTVKSPHDVSGANAHLPAPLRVVHYCPTHTRPWIAGAHRSLATRVILTHLALGGKPIFNAEKERQKVGADDLGFQLPEQKRRRRRRLGR